MQCVCHGVQIQTNRQWIAFARLRPGSNWPRSELIWKKSCLDVVLAASIRGMSSQPFAARWIRQDFFCDPNGAVESNTQSCEFAAKCRTRDSQQSSSSCDIPVDLIQNLSQKLKVDASNNLLIKVIASRVKLLINKSSQCVIQFSPRIPCCCSNRYRTGSEVAHVLWKELGQKY